MKTIFRCAAVLIVLLVAVPGFAGKVGFIDAERAVREVGEGQAKLGELKQWAMPHEVELERMVNHLQELQKRLENQGQVASKEALELLADEEREARRAFEDAKREYERELTARHDEVLGDVALKVGTVASDYGKANGYDAIFMLRAQPLVYLSKDADLTALIVRLYDERFPPPKDIREIPE